MQPQFLSCSSIYYDLVQICSIFSMLIEWICMVSFSEANKLMTGRFAYLSSPTGRALSLLSSKSDSWVSSAELSLRSSAALRELIAENRAAILARQLILDRDWHWHHHGMEDSGGEQPGSDSLMPHQHQMFPGSRSWERFHEANGHVTLDLMQAPSSAFGLLSVREKSKEEEEECSELWNSLEGTHVVWLYHCRNWFSVGTV